jgi:predicted nucleic acid-binding protein
MIALRLGIDSNILVCAALKPQGSQRTVLVIAMAKPGHLYFSSKTLAEYKEVLSRPEIRIRICVINYFNSCKTKRMWLNLRAASK